MNIPLENSIYKGPLFIFIYNQKPKKMGEVANYNYPKEAIEKIKEVVDDVNIAMLCTNLNQIPIATCPMGTMEVEDNGLIWFFSSKNSDHNRDVKNDERVQLIYAHPGNASFLSLYGTAEILYDRQKIDQLWNSAAKVWFQEGKDDPNLTLLCFRPEEGYYWDTKHNKMTSFLKMAASIVSGKTMDDGVQGKLNI